MSQTKYHISQFSTFSRRFPFGLRLAGATAGLLAICVVLFAATSPTPAGAQTGPTLGAAESFAVLGNTTVTNTGATTVYGNVGVTPGTAITGFPPGVVLNGILHSNTGDAQNALVDAGIAFGELDQTCTGNLTGNDLGNMTLTPGVYCFDVAADLTGTLTLNAEGDPDAVFIFKTGSTLTTASASSVNLIGDANACNVFWRVGSSATLGGTTSFAGNIIAQASVTLNTGATIDGRAIALTGAVTLDTNIVDSRACSSLVATPTPEPTATTVPPTATATTVAATATTAAATPEATATATSPANTPTTPAETATPVDDATSTPEITPTPPGLGQVPPIETQTPPGATGTPNNDTTSTPTASPTSPSRGQVPPLATSTPFATSTETPAPGNTGTPSASQTPTFDGPTPGAPSAGSGMAAGGSTSSSLVLGAMILLLSGGGAMVRLARQR